MRVLVACERSGVVRRAFRERGHDAWSCDLSPADDGSPFHYCGDAISAAYGLNFGITDPWDLMIAHPPCTYLCNSGVWAFSNLPPNPSPGVFYGEDRIAAMRFGAWLAGSLWSAPIKRIALENPIMHGLALQTINEFSNRPFGKPSQTIQPYQFGDDASKGTCLWLLGLDPLVPLPEREWASARVREEILDPERAWEAYQKERDEKERWSNQTDSGQNKLPPSADRAKLRSETYPGVARAMAEQWGTGKTVSLFEEA